MGCGRMFTNTTRPDSVKRHQQSLKCKNNRARDGVTGGSGHANFITPIDDPVTIASNHDHVSANVSQALLDVMEEVLPFDYDWEDSTSWPQASPTAGQTMLLLDEFQMNFDIGGHY
ncbi:hypothetical protein EIP86_002689 [Pleurotus ostreatoroseus]|nr:hypothetical protein EIP86_002689 [Pleurotus ostreatoroseus]